MPHATTQNRLNDRDILTDLLLMAKHMIGAYGLAERESAHPQLRATLHRLATEEEQFHTQAFQAMHQRGWYETPLADNNLPRQIASLWSSKLQQHAATAANQQYPATQPQPAWQSQPTVQQPYSQQYGQPYAQQPVSQPYGQGQQYGQEFSQQYGQPSHAYGTPPPVAAHVAPPGAAASTTTAVTTGSVAGFGSTTGQAAQSEQSRRQ